MDYSPLIAFLRQKQYITALEKDILNTWDELQKIPFDRDSAELQVKKIDFNYPAIHVAILGLPTTVIRPFTEATDDDIRYNLKHQLNALIAKELEELNRGK